jgi:asparagine synthase (glutamine-hydrolysing)
MCGIAGFIGLYDPILLEKMSDSIAHRGPDDAGIWYDPQCGVGLAHRRLSIIDLSSAGRQPMWDVERRAVITFNGEIYNYRELRAGLENDGYQFNSATDTEVLLNLYLRDGVSFLKRLNGIFAFALWDVKKRKLLLARDGLGVKPLYYASTKIGVVFASEIKALIQIPELNRELDAVALLYYISYLYAPYPHTPLRSVRKLEPGHAAWINSAGIEKKWPFYRLPYHQPIAEVAVDTIVEQLRDSLDVAVRRQMVADVPVGAFLSGGLDSSAVVAFARKYVSDNNLECFTIGFKDGTTASEGMPDDLPYAIKVAAHLGVHLNVVEVGSDMAEHFEEMIWRLDEPQADTAPLNVLYICELARKNGIKVLLSGAGGDDIFSGYRHHFALMQEKYWDWLPKSARRALRALSGILPADTAAGRRLSKAFRYADETPQRRLASYLLWIDPVWLQKLAGERLRDEALSLDPLAPMLKILNELPEGTPPLNQMLALDASYFLTDLNLNYTDKMSMAAGVEVRVPLLDTDLVAFATRLPPELKQHGATGKWIFKKAMEPLLPRNVIYRPKTGFGVPLRRWLQQDLRVYVEELLSENALKNRGLFNPKAVKELISLDRCGKIDAAYPIFSLICIELWMRLFIDGKAVRN